MDIKTDGECALGDKPVAGSCLNPAQQDAVAKWTKVKDYVMAKKVLGCTNDGCVLEKVDNPQADEIKKVALKAEGPANSKELISNFNIADIFKQLEAKFPDFQGYPFQYHDFINHAESEPMKDPPSPDKSKKTYGIVVNTDVTGGPGIHWFALFVDMRKAPWTIEYFNSSGNKPQAPINQWMQKLKDQICSAGQCEIILSNDRFQHQKGDTECGLYSMYYIWSRLNGVSYTDFGNGERIPDAKMTEFRKQLFR